MVRYHLMVYGRIQGVGFRFFVQQLAIQYSLTGWVRNLDDGRVEIEIQGISEKVELFEINLVKGNRFIRVDHLDQEKIELIKPDRGFRIVYLE